MYIYIYECIYTYIYMYMCIYTYTYQTPGKDAALPNPRLQEAGPWEVALLEHKRYAQVILCRCEQTRWHDRILEPRGGRRDIDRVAKTHTSFSAKEPYN